MAIEKTDEALVMKQREIMEEINHLPHGGKKSLIYTLGCQQNESDSEKLSRNAQKNGYTPTENPEEADVILFNTCAVRENAEKKLFGRVGALKPLKEKNPELLLGVCGCMAQEARNGGKIPPPLPLCGHGVRHARIIQIPRDS